MSGSEINENRRRLHPLALFSAVIVFIPLYFFTGLNPIYPAAIAMLTGGVGSMLCRPDLSKKILGGGTLFLALYFAFFQLFDLAYPGMVQKIWNLKALSGILVVGVPIEELMYAFTFGVLWSSLYEHVFWYRLKKK